MVGRRGTRVRTARTPRRKFVWARVEANFTLGADSSGRVDALTDFNTAYGADLLGATVVRLRGYATIDGADRDKAILAALVESAPPSTVNDGGPVHRPFGDWMMFEPFIVTTAAADPSARLIDVRSSRKIEELQDQLSIYWSTSGANAGPVTLDCYLSIGLKLP